ncbi:hypothetical protein ABZP36_027690 [Zizania latifolia]
MQRRPALPPGSNVDPPRPASKSSADPPRLQLPSATAVAAGTNPLFPPIWCQVYHKFVDNLGLVVEYNLREENGVNTDTED